MRSTETALILGATGSVGNETAQALRRRGWRIRALHRNPARARATLPEAEWIGGDAMNPRDVAAAAKGTEIIFHGVNPPGYRDWNRLALPMLDSTIEAAADSGARIVVPGTVYNYGPDAFPLLAEDSPQTPTTRKGAIRVEMERRLRCAADERGVPVLIVRGGDFFGPHTGSSWFSQGMVKPGRPLSSVTYPGDSRAGHAWAYLPDLAETFARLLDRSDELATFERFHFAGHWLERGREMAERTRLAAGAPDAPIRRFPWWLVRALSPVVPLFREMAEIRYLWRTPVRLDGSRLANFLGEEPHTDLDSALQRTLAGLGCIVRPQIAGPESTARTASAP